MKIKIIAFLIIITIIAGGIFFFLPKEKISLKFPLIPTKKVEVELYFSSKDAKYLVKETRQIPKIGDTISQSKAVLNELIKGPTSKDLYPTIPEGTQIRELYLHENTAYIDFSKELIRNHIGGSSGEIHTIFSIVNTLTLNFPKIKYVQILVEGNEVETLTGHLDTTLPFKQNLSLIQHKTKDIKVKTQKGDEKS